MDEASLIEQLIEQLSGIDHFERRDAARRLGEFAETNPDTPMPLQAVSALINALEDDDIDVCLAAAKALGKIGDESAVPALINALKNENAEVWMSAVEALVYIGEPAVSALIEFLKDDNEVARWSAFDALEKIGKPAVHALINALKNENPNVRKGAAHVLGAIAEDNPGSEEAIQAVLALAKALKDTNQDVRESATRWLVRLGEPGLAAVNEAYLRGEIEHEEAQAFYDALGKKLGDGFDKGTIAPPKKKPDELKRAWIRKPQAIRPKTQNPKPETLKRCVAGG